MATLPLREQYPMEGYDHDDPILRTGEGGLTVWVLLKMAQEKRFQELDDLFDNGLNMNALPVGMCAGTGVATLDVKPKLIDEKVVNEWMSGFAGKNWRGKIFFSSNNKRVSQGRNRLRSSWCSSSASFVPMMKFTTMLLDSHPLAPRAKSNLVTLNYDDPLTKPYLQEFLATKLHALDVQVAVKGKYGPVYIGKTWFGKYDKNGKFTAHDPNKVVGRYFIDFNEGALKEQRESHLDGCEEDILDPLPHIEY
jgi:hypothetical protein